MAHVWVIILAVVSKASMSPALIIFPRIREQSTCVTIQWTVGIRTEQQTRKRLSELVQSPCGPPFRLENVQTDLSSLPVDVRMVDLRDEKHLGRIDGKVLSI